MKATETGKEVLRLWSRQTKFEPKDNRDDWDPLIWTPEVVDRIFKVRYTPSFKKIVINTCGLELFRFPEQEVMDEPANVGAESSEDGAFPESSQELSSGTVVVPGPNLLRTSLYDVLGWTPQDLAYAYVFQQQHAELDCHITGIMLSAKLHETSGRDNSQQDCRDVVRSLRHQQKWPTIYWSKAECAYLEGYVDRFRDCDAKALGFKLVDALKEEYGTDRTPRSCQHKATIYRNRRTLADNLTTADSKMREAQPYKEEFGLIALQSIVREPLPEMEQDNASSG